LKPRQNEFEYQAKIIHLVYLLWLESQDYIQVYYDDESRISMNSYLPSAWQSKDNPICIVPERSVGLNVFGLLNREMDFHPYTSKESINSALIIRFIDDFLKNALKGMKVIILDNASTHRSEEFKDQIKRWEEEDLFIFFLPAYSPHLNIIETLWRKIKYEWLEQHNFIGSNSFFDRLDFILLNIGNLFSIEFNNQTIPE